MSDQLRIWSQLRTQAGVYFTRKRQQQPPHKSEEICTNKLPDQRQAMHPCGAAFWVLDKSMSPPKRGTWFLGLKLSLKSNFTCYNVIKPQINAVNSQTESLLVEPSPGRCSCFSGWEIKLEEWGTGWTLCLHTQQQNWTGIFRNKQWWDTDPTQECPGS